MYMQISFRRAPTQTYQHLKTAFPYLTSRAARFTLHHSLANEWSPKSGTGISNTATVPLPKQLSRPKLNIGHIQGHARVSPGQEKDARIFKQGFFLADRAPGVYFVAGERALSAISKMQNFSTPENATRRPTPNPKTQKRKRVKRKMQFLAPNL